tara:strand:+ start:1187 stop:1351 length:165 start_codon:yes stop_codon:yes gene_type:complete
MLKMNVSDLKLYGVNFIALMTSMTNLDVILKIILSIIAIGYTLHKWYIMYGKNK